MGDRLTAPSDIRTVRMPALGNVQELRCPGCGGGAPFEEAALPARRCIPAITGAAVSVLIVVASGERPLRRICLPGRGVLDEYMAAFERSDTDFESRLATHPTIAGRWLSWVAGRLAASQARILGLLGRNLSAQVAQLLLDEQHDGTVELAQRTLAAMLGVQRPSLNKVLKDFERDRLITVRYAAVDVLDPARLTRLAT